MRRIRFSVFLLLNLFSILSANAQPGFQPRPGEPPGSFPFNLAYYEAVNTPSATPGLSRIDVAYRIDLSFFISVRNRSKPLSSGFVRKGELQIELMDSTGTTAARKIQRFEEPATSAEIKPGSAWHSGLVSFDLVPGNFTIVIAIEDLESERSVSEKNRRVIARDFPPDQTVMSPPFFITPPDVVVDDSTILFPVNFGGGIRFGEPAHLVLQAMNDSTVDPTTTSIRVARLGKDTDRDSAVVHTSVAQPTILRRSVLVTDMYQHKPAYRITRADSNLSVLLLPFPAEKLQPGAYILTLTVDTLTLKHPFTVVWPGMPKSLQNPDYAFESLRFITTADELDSLNSGSEEERRKQFDEFWAARDGTSETAFNEVKEEYYSRVDHAAATFGTLREPDGSRTDRGRIHVLYGIPTRIERNLDPTGFIEVWSYETARKKFIFLDETRTGSYVLTSTRPL